MPIPKPKPKENKKDFLDRCISDATMKKEFKNIKQRIAVCLDQTKQNKNK
jgi:hypothetical protein